MFGENENDWLILMSPCSSGSIDLSSKGKVVLIASLMENTRPSRFRSVCWQRGNGWKGYCYIFGSLFLLNKLGIWNIFQVTVIFRALIGPWLKWLGFAFFFFFLC